MKKLFLIALAICSVMWMSFQSDIPKAVKDKFASMYPNVKKVEWEKEGDHYEAEFKYKGVETSVVFDVNGTHIQTETEIKSNELPANVASYVSQNYPDYKIKEAAKIISANGTITYEAEVSKGRESMDLLFDNSGNFMKRENEVDDDKK